MKALASPDFDESGRERFARRRVKDTNVEHQGDSTSATASVSVRLTCMWRFTFASRSDPDGQIRC